MTDAEADEILGLEPPVTDRELRDAYHREARRWHPDVAGAAPGEREVAGDRMKLINLAFERLRKSR
jgi:curved DNA-binding protein CbpA